MPAQKPLLRRLRRRIDRIAAAPFLVEGAANLVAARLRAWHRSIDWTVEGAEGLAALRARGQPAIIAIWHGRLAMSPWIWRAEWGRVCTLTSAAPPGRVVGAVQARFGIETLPMRDRGSNLGVSMQAARLVRKGVSIGIASDGPLGPPRILKPVPVEWSRLTGAPVWLWTYSVERNRHMAAWDRMLLPRGGGAGVMLYRPWDVTVPKRLDPAGVEALRLRLQTDLDALTLSADRAMGHPGILC
jgi:hypothetical protein